jgi:hypothetical protein
LSPAVAHPDIDTALAASEVDENSETATGANVVLESSGEDEIPNENVSQPSTTISDAESAYEE